MESERSQKGAAESKVKIKNWQEPRDNLQQLLVTHTWPLKVALHAESVSDRNRSYAHRLNIFL